MSKPITIKGMAGITKIEITMTQWSIQTKQWPNDDGAGAGGGVRPAKKALG